MFFGKLTVAVWNLGLARRLTALCSGRPPRKPPRTSRGMGSIRSSKPFSVTARQRFSSVPFQPLAPTHPFHRLTSILLKPTIFQCNQVLPPPTSPTTTNNPPPHPPTPHPT